MFFAIKKPNHDCDSAFLLVYGLFENLTNIDYGLLSCFQKFLGLGEGGFGDGFAAGHTRQFLNTLFAVEVLNG